MNDFVAMDDFFFCADPYGPQHRAVDIFGLCRRPFLAFVVCRNGEKEKEKDQKKKIKKVMRSAVSILRRLIDDLAAQAGGFVGIN